MRFGADRGRRGRVRHDRPHAHPAGDQRHLLGDERGLGDRGERPRAGGRHEAEHVSAAAAGSRVEVDGLQTPPSTYSRSPIVTGVNSHGTAHDASTASRTLAVGAPGAPNRTRAPLPRSTAATRSRPSKVAASVSRCSPRRPSVRCGRGEAARTAERASRPGGARPANASGASGLTTTVPARAAARARPKRVAGAARCVPRACRAIAGVELAARRPAWRRRSTRPTCPGCTRSRGSRGRCRSAARASTLRPASRPRRGRGCPATQ